MFFNGNNFLNYFLCNCPCKFPMGNSHYMCGKDILLFKNILCVENNLTNLTCNCKQMCNGLKNNFIR